MQLKMGFEIGLGISLEKLFAQKLFQNNHKKLTFGHFPKILNLFRA